MSTDVAVKVSIDSQNDLTPSIKSFLEPVLKRNKCHFALIFWWNHFDLKELTVKFLTHHGRDIILVGIFHGGAGPDLVLLALRRIKF